MSFNDTQTETQLESGDWQERSATRVPGLTVLYHSDLARVGERVLLPELSGDGTVALSRLAPLFSAPGDPSAAPLGDSRLSRKPLRLESTAASSAGEPGLIRISRDASPTSLVIDGDAVIDHREFAGGEVERGVILLLGGRVVLLLHTLDPLVPPNLPYYGLVGESPAMLRVRRDIARLAGLDVPVLLRGETGTGKELAARALHDSGPRREGPFVAVNLSALPASLAAAELFGAQRGAFTGADRRREGYFARADGGTLFLDEVGDASTELQVLLLRALESGEIQPLGDERARRVDVRVVAATDADLESRARRGDFRAPLLYRLGGFVLRLPALRERRDDFGRLFAHLLRQELEVASRSHRLAPARRPWIPASLLARLAAHSWPGNVRQLRNLVRQLVVSHRDDDEVRLDVPLEHLLGDAVPPPPGSPASAARRPTARRAVDIREDELIAALRAERWRLHATAARLGIPRSSLYRLIERCPRVRTAADLEAGEIVESLGRHGASTGSAAEALEVSVVGLRRRMRQLGIEN